MSKGSYIYIEKHYRNLKGIMQACTLSNTEIQGVLGYMKKYEINRGPEDLVSMLKSRITDLIAVKKIYKRHVDTTWYGPLRPISRLALRGRRGLRRALRVLRCYGIFKAKHPDYSVWSHHRYAICERYEKVDYLRLTPSHEVFETSRGLESISYDRFYPLSTSKAPLNREKNLPEIDITPKEHIETMQHFPTLIVNHYDYVASLIGKDMPPKTHFQALQKSSVRDVAGTTALLVKDRGLKTRLIANPFRILQLLCSRIHNTAMELVKRLPGSYVYDQDSGAEWVAGKLAEGCILTSLDLKAATDNVPMLPQVDVLRQVCPHLEEDLNVFQEICRMDWWGAYTNMRWTYGTPMGLKGSFALFTIWLVNMLLIFGNTKGRFAVVGDDLVFESYLDGLVLNFLSIYEVPISTTKSLFSNSIFAEFVGKIIDKKGSLEVFKASPFKFYDDPMGLIRQYGPRGFRFLGTKVHPGIRKDIELVHQFQKYHDSATLIPYANKKDLRLFTEKRARYSKYGISYNILMKICDEQYPRFGYLYSPAVDVLMRRDVGRAMGVVLNDKNSPPVLVQQWEFAKNDPHLTDVVNAFGEALETSYEVSESDELVYKELSSMLSPIGDVQKAEAEVLRGKIPEREFRLFSKPKLPISFVRKFSKGIRRTLKTVKLVAILHWLRTRVK